MDAPTAAPQTTRQGEAVARRQTKRRKKKFSVYLTRDELAQVRATVHRNRSGHFVAAVLGRPSPSAEIPPINTQAAAALKALRGDLGRVGSNLNQATRRLNQNEPGSTVAQVLAEGMIALDDLRERITAALTRLERPAAPVALP